MENKSKITYRRVGDYFIPNLILPPEETNVTLGKWGILHKAYLEKNKKVFFSSLIAQGKLYQHCAKVEKQVNEMYDLLIAQMKAAEGVTEQLKENNQLEWIQRTGNIEQRVREIIYEEMICVNLNDNI